MLRVLKYTTQTRQPGYIADNWEKLVNNENDWIYMHGNVSNILIIQDGTV